MKDATLAIRYAKAYVDLALSKDELEPAVRGARQASDFFASQADARHLLATPLVPAEEKAAALSRAMDGIVEASARQLATFVIGKGRAEYLPEILRQVIVLYEGIEGIRHAEVVSAVPLTQEQSEELSARLKALTGANRIVLHASTDPSLIGGIRVKTGDTVWDGTLSGRLEELKKKYL